MPQPSSECDERLALILEEGPADGSRLLACLQSWAPCLQEGRSPESGPPPAFHYRLRGGLGVGELPDSAQIARRIASLSPPLPRDWGRALVHGWPPRLRGLHRIELVPGIAWVSIEMGLKPVIRRRLDAQASAWIARRRAASTCPAPGETRQAEAHAIVVGAGLAGCAMADALLRRGWRVTIIEAADRTGGAVAEIPLLAQHPALSPGEDRRSRLLIAALLTSRRLADRLGSALAWCGRFQPMPLAEALRRTAGMPDSLARAVRASQLAEHGVAGLQGIWYPDCAMADPARWWQRVQVAPGAALQLSRPVAAIVRDSGRWQALDDRRRPIAAAPVLILANQAGAFLLAAMPPQASGSLRRSRIQVAIGTAVPKDQEGPEARQETARVPRILGGSSYRLEVPGRHCVIGPLRPDVDSLARHDIHLPGLTIGHPAYRWALCRPAERLLLRDNLPMIGAAPDSAAIAAGRRDYERNDRLPLPRQPDLHLLTGLGGRGLLWSMLGAEIIAAAVNEEPAIVEQDLQDALDPARFLRRALRRGSTAGGFPPQ